MEKVAQLSWESTCLTSRGSLVRAQQRPPLFFWGCSSAGQSAGLSRQRSRVRVPSLPPYKPRQLSRQSKGLKIPVSVVRFRVWAPCRTLIMATWSRGLGRGLQNLVHRFDSGRRLHFLSGQICYSFFIYRQKFI